MCKLAFDPKAERVAAPRRDRAVAPEAESVVRVSGIVIARDADATTIRWSYERIQGIAYAVLGVVCAVMLVRNLRTPGEQTSDLLLLGLATAGTLYVGSSRLFSDTVMRIDARQITVRHEPIPTRRTVWVGVPEIAEIKVTRSRARGTSWTVEAITPRGAIVLARFDPGSSEAADAAELVAQEIRAALAAA